jgi:hypothetical protein
MGYAADMISNDVDIVLKADRLPAVIKALYTAQEVLGSHISWCNDLDSYDQSDKAAFVAEVFSDYGFGTKAEDGNVYLDYWGGDKVGSCFDEMMVAIAVGVDQPIETVWQGEDGSIWAVRFDGQGGVRQADAVVTFDFGD